MSHQPADDRAARIEPIVRRYEAGEISYETMTEEIVLSDEQADDARRQTNGIA